MHPVALSIAGSDPSGGAGLQADLKTFQAFDVYGLSVVTLLTTQNTTRDGMTEPVPQTLVEAQLDSVTADIPPHAAKTGALGTCATVELVTNWAGRTDIPLVVDPVMVSTRGGQLLSVDARTILIQKLIPNALLVTPNLDEVREIIGTPVDDVEQMEKAARLIAQSGCKGVLVKGGHLTGEPIDVLWWDGRIERFSGERVISGHTHGTGCTYSAAITAELAKGCSMVDAVGSAKLYVTDAIRNAPKLGQGAGPLNHGVDIA
tara:strand:- start:3980 stop:4762 length:783 start_codon:yes stop_codon:yes gene_type:complete